jgi:hypothetical protein
VELGGGHGLSLAARAIFVVNFVVKRLGQRLFDS